MEIRWLEAFIAVAEELHFSRAAQRLNLAQSPLSQTIRAGQRPGYRPLRNTRSVPCRAGPIGFEDLELGHQTLLVHGTVRSITPGALNHSPLTSRLARAARPGDDRGEVEHRRRDLDLAFVGLRRTRLIGREPLAVVLPVDHPLAARQAIDLADLADEQFISLPLGAGSSLAQLTAQACVDAGFRPRIVQEITDPFMILTLVSAGVGIALMTSAAVQIMPAAAVLRPLTGRQTYMQHALAWVPDNPSPVLRAVLDLAEEVLPTPPPD